MIFPTLFSKIAIALAVSTDEKRQYLDFDIHESKIKLVGNGVNLDIFRPGKSDFRRSIGLADNFLVSFVGRLDPIKGVPVLLEAFYLFQKNCAQAKLAIIGP